MVNSFANFHVSTKAALLALLIASPWLIVQVGIVILGPDREITEMPVCDSTSGNCAHLGGGDDYRLLEQYPTFLDILAEPVYNNLIQYIEHNDWNIIHEDSTGDTYYVHFVETTKFWQFPDDVIVLIRPTTSGCIIEIHSESRLGWGDLGLNPERIDTVYEAIVS